MLLLEPVTVEEYRMGIDHLLDRYNLGELVIRTDPDSGIRLFFKRVMADTEGFTSWTQDSDEGFHDFIVNDRLP